MHGTAFGPEEANDKHSFSEWTTSVGCWRLFPVTPSCAWGPGWCETQLTATQLVDDGSLVFTEGHSAGELRAISVP